MVHDRVSIEEIGKLTEDEYQAGGSTALIDAIHHIGNVHKYVRPEDVPVRSLYLAGTKFPFTEEEAQAIIYHDGQYVEGNSCVATHEEKLTLLLQYADNWSGFVKETQT